MYTLYMYQLLILALLILKVHLTSDTKGLWVLLLQHCQFSQHSTSRHLEIQGFSLDREVI